MEFAKMRSRKFSFDIPRLKIGPSKADNRAFRDQIAAPLDSPVEQPKSVRPPLSPIVDAELRSACAYVLQNFRPSHVVYKEQHGDGGHQKQQLDYAAIKESVHRDMEVPALMKIETTSHESAAIEDDSVRSDSVSSDRYKYKPEVPTQDLFRREDAARDSTHRRALSRAEELMAPPPSRVPATSTRLRSQSHSRSASNQAQVTSSAAKKEFIERPGIALRADSMETDGSTPQTDSTDYPWSEKASTAMTSAAVTPARGSKRTSSQALQPGSDAGSIPIVEPVNGDWMRQELAKIKRAQEERARQENGRESLTPGEGTTSTQTLAQTTSTTPVSRQVVKRKPVPQRTDSKRDREQSRADSGVDSRVSMDQPRTAVLHVREPSEAASGQGAYTERSGSCVTNVSDRPSTRLGERARSITRQVRQYVHPDTAQDGLRPGRSLRRSASRASNRAASVTRRVKDYIRPDTAVNSRKPSVELGRDGTRAPSVDTSRTNISDADSQSTNKWQTWRPFHRRGASRSSEDGDRPGTAGSTTDTRGRSTARDAGSQSGKSKPPIDLNRKLPPLPSLDQWQDATETQQPAVNAASFRNEGFEHAATSKSHTRQESKQDSDQILQSRMGSPRSHKHLRSVDVRAPPQPTAPPPALPTLMGATMNGPADISYDQYAPEADQDFISTASESKHTRRRSKTIDTPEGFYGIGSNPSMYAAAKSHETSKAYVPECVAATSSHTATGHSRNISDRSNLLRKLSMDEYGSRVYDSRSLNVTGFPSSKRTPTSPSLHSKEKKWWRWKLKPELVHSG